MTDMLKLTRPDDLHLHLRDGAMLKAVLPSSAAHFARALIMPIWYRPWSPLRRPAPIETGS